jgi:hypothetical protein
VLVEKIEKFTESITDQRNLQRGEKQLSPVA